MKTLVSLKGIAKPVGTISKILYPVNQFDVGDELEVVDEAEQIINMAIVTSVDNGIEIEITA